MKKLGVFIMNFTGGEPLLREDLPEIFRISKRHGFFNILTTNCIEYPEKASQITKFIDHLVFSLDSPSENEHNRIRGVGCYDRIMDSIKIAKGLGKHPIINFTITRGSIAALPDMVDLCSKLRVLLWINPVYNWSGLEGFEKRSIDYIARYFGRRNVGLNLASLDVLRSGGNRINRPVCRAGEATITILPDNTLAAPCLYLQKGTFKIENNLLDLVKRREVKLSTSLHGKDEACKGCMAWEYLNPSFLHVLNKRTFLALYSILSLFWKELNFKKGARI